MSSWSDNTARVNASKLAVFGFPVTYYPSFDEAEPLTITAIRDKLLALAAGAAPQWDAISIDPASLPSYPVEGDKVTLENGLMYRVGKVSQPDPYSLVNLSLNQRAGQPHP
jgi:hypothetical protein